MVGKEVICERIKRSLEMCKINECEEYFEIDLPIITTFNQQLLTLRLYPFEDYYYVCNDGYTFDEYPEYSANYCEKYYNLFTEKDSHFHYQIQRNGAYLYKKYDPDYSARAAVDEFIRFFLYLDDFMLDYWNKE